VVLLSTGTDGWPEAGGRVPAGNSSDSTKGLQGSRVYAGDAEISRPEMAKFFDLPGSNIGILATKYGMVELSTSRAISDLSGIDYYLV
jgi:Mrp family chromosome partitioning ATPase